MLGPTPSSRGGGSNEAARGVDQVEESCAPPGVTLPPARPAPTSLALGPIVIVEDDRVARTVLVKYLRDLRLANPVVTCADGDEAVARLAGDDAATAPALVVMDRHLPGISGLDVVLWMREQPTLRDVPVVMLSASSDVEGIHEGYALGVAAYLVKPVAFAALGDVLRSLPLPWAIVAPEPSEATG